MSSETRGIFARAIAAAALTILAGAALAGCAEGAAETPGAQQSVIEDVAFYPACGNETLTLDGTTWYSLASDATEGFPVPLALGSADTWPSKGTSRSMRAVVAPGPGDDTGTLVIYDGGYAYFRSDNGDLTRWLTTEKTEYAFVC
jgi:hypothetical protein